MGITEEIFTRCQQVFEESANLLTCNKKTTYKEIQIQRHAASIAGQAAFVLLQKAFITPFDREDIWDFRQACESVRESAQEISLIKKPFLQGSALCCELSHLTEQLLHARVIQPSTLFEAERKFKELPPLPIFRDFLHCGQEVIFCMERLLLKRN